MDINELSREECVDMFSAVVYRLALAHTSCKADAEDVFQDVFLALWETDKRFNDSEHMKAWLITVTLNKCRAVYNSNKKRDWAELDENIPADEPEENIGVYEAIARLPLKYREPTVLFYLEDMSTQQIAQVLGISDAAVRTRLTRGREMLRKLLI